MRLFNYLADVISGRVAHWNRTHTKVVSETWEKIQNLPFAEKSIFETMLVHASFFVETLLNFPERRSRKDATPIDVRDVSIDQFHRLYAVLLAYFVFGLGIMRPSYRLRAREGLSRIVSVPESALEFIERLEAAPETKPPNSKSTGWSESIEALVWDEIVETIGRQDLGGFALPYMLRLIGAATELLKEILPKLDLAIRT